ncbi:sialate O-acetylesterase [Spirosoma sp. KCTC 42546]|uniref:sialate O-acetylesterase n=1 Tax=Spirosoma sp. KCTC 42546 TaxID=2520506 RepID=UPI00115866ED|nr:sialate O-acetylesterase [Spirosoma sp. KCTC 42546]QDK77716.1 sialate O-acetylesterase [Spirosoma sp. KCTC 42546]
MIHTIYRAFFLCALPYLLQAQFIINSPKTRSVIQRDGANRAQLIIAGTAPNSSSTIEARLIPMVVGQGTPSDWTTVATVTGDHTFRGTLAALGGWYRVEIRAKAATAIIADTAVNRIGVGEVFVIAGQSNAQGGIEKNVPPAIDDRVSCIDLFQYNSIDTQAFPFMFSHVSAGASIGPSNSPYLWGILGDSLTKRLNVPILFLGAAQGGSNSTEWAISAAATPATLPYQRISATLLSYINRLGMRAILWHQGESDGGVAEQAYVNNLNSIISKSRQQLNHSRLAWLISRASYISGQTNSQVIAAQNRLSREVSDVYAGPATDGLIGPDNRVDDIHFGGNGLWRVANLWNQSLTDLFFSQSIPFIPTTSTIGTDAGWQPVTTGSPFSSLQRVGYRYESSSRGFFLLVGSSGPVEGRLERLDSGEFTDTSWSTLTPTASSSSNNPGFSDYASLRGYPSSISPGRYRLSVRQVGDTGPGYQLETVLHDYRNTLFIGNEPVIQQTGPVVSSDLTINLDLPQANFATAGNVDNFVVNVFEVAGLPTSSGNVRVNITVPVGYSLSFASSLTNINVSGGAYNPVAVDNSQWTATPLVADRQLTLTMNAGTFIPGNGKSSLGFSIIRTTANPGSAANITVNVADDPTKSYDSNLSNNVYVRVISGL